MKKNQSPRKNISFLMLAFLLVLPTWNHAIAWSELWSNLYSRYRSQSTTCQVLLPTITLAALAGGSWLLSNYWAKQREAHRLATEQQRQEEERLLAEARRITIERNQQRLQQAEQGRPKASSYASLPDEDINNITNTTNAINMQLSPHLSNEDFENIAGSLNSIIYAYPQLHVDEITPTVLNKQGPIRYNITKSIIYQIINKALENNPEVLAAFRIQEIYNIIRPQLDAAVSDQNNTAQAYNLMLSFLDYNPYCITPQQEGQRGELAATILGLQNPHFGVNAMSKPEWLQQIQQPRPAVPIEAITQEEPQRYTEQLINIYSLP